MDREPEQPPRPQQQKSSSARDSATYFALVGVVCLGLGLLALFGAVTFGIMFFGVVGVILGLAALVAFHYVTWGWLMSSLRGPDEQPERWW